MSLPSVSLDDKYTRDEGRIYLTGSQALVRRRLVRRRLVQRRRDLAVGLNTAGFIAGYRGSPMTAIDMELWRAEEQTAKHQVRFCVALQVLASHQRTHGGDRRLGYPAGPLFRRCRLRWRLCHVVRQGAGPRPEPRCHPPGQLPRRREARRRADTRRRRFGHAFYRRCLSFGTAVRGSPDAGAVPGGHPGGVHPRPLRHRVVAFPRRLGRLQAAAGDHRDGRLHSGQPRRHRHRPARLRISTG